MQRKRCHLHLGAHKTATTSFQRFLKVNLEDLQKTQSVDVMLPNIMEEIGAFRVIARARRDAEPKMDVLAKAKEHLNAWFAAAPNKKSVLSHEGLVGQHNLHKDRGLYPGIEKACDMMAALFDGQDLSVAFVIRAQAAYLESTYLQAVHYANYMPFDDYVEGADIATLSWQRVINALNNSFGRDKVRIVPFEYIKTSEGNFYATLLEQLMGNDAFEWVKTATFDDNRNQNASLSETALKIIAKTAPLMTREELPLMVAFLRQHFSNTTHERAKLCSPKLKRQILKYFADENAAIFDNLEEQFQSFKKPYVIG